ncbi:MAG: orotidine-5'-phosphate decarboxylase [Bdellovibrionaceae bacterium]|jgi:orotidine-5'-phosphate decarboxylase|nr:orotidine-5'-phosphate decarboxylase [Pseudobdellovibrionaceae bacterium]
METWNKNAPPIFVALDVDTEEEALSLAGMTSGFVGGYKVGPRLCMKYGEPLIKKLAALGSVFIDNKYFDIPNTMESAVRATFNSGASFATVHAQSGREALKRMAELEAELNKERFFKILSVTVLTSFSKDTLPGTVKEVSLKDQVRLLAQESVDAGLSGLVCSAHEVEDLRAMFPDCFLVTPGIRFPDEDNADQKRVMGPREAIACGSSALVVGRPICASSNPLTAAQKFYYELMATDVSE